MANTAYPGERSPRNSSRAVSFQKDTCRVLDRSGGETLPANNAVLVFLSLLPGPAASREQSRGWFGTTAIIVAVDRTTGHHDGQHAATSVMPEPGRAHSSGR